MMEVPWQDVNDIAKLRSHRGRFSKTHYGVIGDPHRIDTIGVIGEWVFAAEFGMPLAELKKSKNVNFHLSDGARVDVRSSESAGMLIVSPKRLWESDVFVLAAVDLRRYSANLVGWATMRDLAEVAPRKISDKPAATPVHALAATQLRPMRELRDRHRQVLPVTQLGLLEE